MKEPETLWEREEQERIKRERIENFLKSTGKTKLPRKIHQGRIIKCVGSDGEVYIDGKELLRKGGYHEMPHGGFVRDFDRIYRYHAYVKVDGNIELHTDKRKFDRRGKQYHIASNYLCGEEKARLTAMRPRPKVEVSKKKYKREVFAGEKLREALIKIKAENEERLRAARGL